jgi:hypothetical protein
LINKKSGSKHHGQPHKKTPTENLQFKSLNPNNKRIIIQPLFNMSFWDVKRYQSGQEEKTKSLVE